MRNIHLSTAIWGEDAAEYRPERWEGAMEGGLPKGVPQGAYIVSPFSSIMAVLFISACVYMCGICTYV